MDDLASIIETSLEVRSSSNTKTDVTNSRLSQYKKIGKHGSAQDNRRFEVLEEQKRRRDQVFAKFRGLLDEVHLQDSMEWSQTQEEENKIWKKKKKNHVTSQIIKQIMYSDWFQDIPGDFNTNWYVKPCPVGHRTLLIASHGKTLSCFKSGIVRRSLYSHLPGGSKMDQNFKDHVVLDCIYNKDTDIHYVLDVLLWKFGTLSCTTEFRFYWLKSKMNELTLQSKDNSDSRFAKIELLPYYPTSELAKLMGSFPIFPDNSPELDGLLFYHKLGLYEPGCTPLVCWIKPFMLPEKLNILVHETYLNEKDSENVLQLMEKENARYYKSSKYKNQRRKKNQESKMETVKQDEDCEHTMEES